MDTTRQFLGNEFLAIRTFLRCIPGRHFNNFFLSFFRFKKKNVKEIKPGCISHRPIKYPIAFKMIHILDIDSIIRQKNFSSNFKMEISSLVKDFLVSLCKQYFRFGSSFRTLFPMGNCSLSFS